MNIFQLTRTYRTARRLRTIIKVFIRHGYGNLIDQLHLGRYVPIFMRLRSYGKWSRSVSSAPVRLKEAFTELGPSFIKFAQLLAMRSDLIPQRYCDEFQSLQDSVQPFPTDEAKEIIEQELEKPFDEIFKSFDPTPIAAASIAQVYRAVLNDGSKVIVKVQRPGIQNIMASDIEILLYLARLIEAYIVESRYMAPVGIVEEFSRTVKKELNFRLEAMNSIRIAMNFKDEPNIHIPTAYPEITTDKVLVMEQIQGKRVDDIDGIKSYGLDTQAIAKTGINAYFKMVLKDGFFHADPHPGNLYVMSDGSVGFMDFGIVGTVNEELKIILSNIFISVLNRDFDRLIDCYINLGLLPQDVDLDKFKREFKRDISDVIEPLYGLPLKNLDFAEYLGEMLRIIVRHRVKVPSELMLIQKVMFMLQSIGTRLDPEFDFVAEATPYVTELMSELYNPKRLVKKATATTSEIVDFAGVFPQQMKRLLMKINRNDMNINLTHKGFEHFIRDMDRSTNRIAFALVISSILLSSAIMHASGVGPSIYGFSVMGFMMFGFAAVLGIWLLISIIRSGRL